MHFTAAFPDAARALSAAKALLPENPSVILMPEACLTVPIVGTQRS